MAIYMEFDSIKGSVTTAGYEGMIKLDFAYFGVYRKTNMTTGEMSSRESTIPKFSVIHMGKRVDSATPDIMKKVFSCRAGKQVKLHYVRTAEKQLNEYLEYTLENCIPAFHRVVALGTSTRAPIERLYLSYSSILISDIPRGTNNKALSSLRFGYDLNAAKSL